MAVAPVLLCAYAEDKLLVAGGNTAHGACPVPVQKSAPDSEGGGGPLPPPPLRLLSKEGGRRVGLCKGTVAGKASQLQRQAGSVQGGGTEEPSLPSLRCCGSACSGQNAAWGVSSQAEGRVGRAPGAPIPRTPSSALSGLSLTRVDSRPAFGLRPLR